MIIGSYVMLAPVLHKNDALAQYKFEPKNKNWAWGGRNAAEGSVCFLCWRGDVVHGPEFGQATVNLLNPADFAAGGNGFNDRWDMIEQIRTQRCDAYVLLYVKRPNSEAIAGVYPKLYSVRHIVNAQPQSYYAIIEAA